MADSLSDEVRQLLQQGIQNVLASFKSAGMHDREDLNTLMSFYRSMHSMSVNAMRIERSLQGRLLDTTRETTGLFREFGSRTNDRLPQTGAAETNPDLQQPGRNAGGNGVEGSSGEPESIGEGGTPYLFLDFGRPEEHIVVPEQEN